MPEIKKINKKSGFTLIELLVVIAIIGLLASVVLVALAQSRIKARDTLLKADISTLDKAIRLFASDAGSYPTTTNPVGGDVCSDAASCNSAPTFSSLLSGGYVNQLPVPPKGSYSFAYFQRLINSPDPSAEIQNTCMTIGSFCGFYQGYDLNSCISASGNIPLGATAKGMLLFRFESGPSSDYTRGGGSWSAYNAICYN